MIIDQTIYLSEFESRKLENLENRVLSILGKRSPIDEFILEQTHELLDESHNYIDGKFGYRILDDFNILFEKDSIKISDDLVFLTKKIIAAQVRDSKGLVLFASTLGVEFDKWLKELFSSNEPLKGYIADLIGSVAVECGADILEAKISEKLSDAGLGCTNRFSPGYCNWNVSEQKKLFSLLPEKFCGIELTPSSLMIPIKSVSGIIGYGKGVVKKEYACKICTQENCYMNKLKTE